MMLESPPDYPLPPPLEFLANIWMLNHALEKASATMETTLGISAPQRLVLRCVGKFPGITAGQLARILHVDPGTISAAIRRLEAKGFLERRRDSRDKRRVNLGLTAEGRELDQPMNHTVEDAVVRLIDRAGARDVAATKRVLALLSQILTRA